MPTQAEMFAKPPRQKPRVLMHVTDAGSMGVVGWDKVVFFECAKCGHQSGWVQSEGVAKDKRGRPCPECN